MLCRADGETRVSNTGLSRVLLRGSNALDIRIETVNTYGERRHTEREAAVPTSEVQDALPAHEPLAAPLAKLVDGARPERGRDRGDVLFQLCGRTQAAYASAVGAQRLRVRHEHAAWLPTRAFAAGEAPR